MSIFHFHSSYSNTNRYKSIMNFRANYIKNFILLFTFWLIGSSLQAQTSVSYVDSTCQVFLALDDSTGNPLSTSPPYLFNVQGRVFSNNNLATANFDFSAIPDGSYPYYVVDGNQNYYRDTLVLNCGNTGVNNAPYISDSTSNASNCTSGLCNGFTVLEVQNIGPQPFLFYIDNDPPISSTNNTLTITNLCSGTYYVQAEDTSGNRYATMIQIGCDNAPSLLNCFPNVSFDLGPDGSVLVSPSDFSSSQPYQDPNFLLIDANGQVTSNITFTCEDLGYYQLGILARDSFNRWDTCQVLVQIEDSLSRCNGSGYQFVDNIGSASDCDTCTASYSFQGINLIANNQQILPPYSFLWSDGDTTSIRNNLCPRVDYTFTVFDRDGNAYITTVTPPCPLSTPGSCYNPNILDSTINCPVLYAPVCGCNQVTYRNACEAELKYGISQWTAGACPDNSRAFQITSSISASSFGCDTSLLNCNGSILINPFGGVSPYTINWAGGRASGFNPSGLCAGSYSATISDNVGNTIYRSFTVGVDGCVWPGDTDDNTSVNNFDLLPIGLTYNTTGFSRNNISINWQGQTSSFWSNNQIPNLPDYRHIDCDGSGTIDSIDIDAIIVNYGRRYARSSTNSLQGNIPFFVTSGNASPGDTIELDVHLGDSRFPVTDAYGVAFTIQYDPNVMDSAKTNINFNNSWLGSDLLSIQKNFSNTGDLEIAVTRKDGNPITGFGALARVSFTIRDDLIMGKATSTDTTVNTPLTIGVVRLIDENNREIGTNRTTGIVTLTPTTNVRKLPILEDGVYVFPNPATKQLHISSEQFAIENIQLWSTTGQLLHEKVASNGWNQSILVNQFPIGIYILKVQTNGGVYTQKITVLK